MRIKPTVSAANVGFEADPDDFYATIGEAVVKGRVYSIDFGEVGTDGVFDTLKADADGASVDDVWCVALEDAASGDRCKFRLRGWTYVLAGTGNVTAETALSAEGGGAHALIDAPAGDIVIAISGAAITATEFGYVLFDGTGFYTKHA